MLNTPAEAIVAPECPKEQLGLAPAILAKRNIIKPSGWCPKPDREFDPWCDPDNPKTILPKHVHKATAAIRQDIPITPLVRSKCCVQLGSEVYYKFESVHRTGSFHERGAQYSLQRLNSKQRRDGVFTASNGNWAKALAFKARRSKTKVTAVLPENTLPSVVDKVQGFGANVVTYGRDLAEAKRHAFALINERGSGTYINGHDHPHVIAAAGAIGVEILEQLPQADAILIPVGGGGLIAGIATVVKELKPELLIYGVQSDKCCSFFKAMVNEKPYKTECGFGLASSLAVPTAGYNAFHTARSLIDKMVVVDDDWIARALLHLAEEEKVVAEGAGAIGLAALLSEPHIVPELRGKTVVCLITSGNIDTYTLPVALDRAKAVEGRLIKMIVKLNPDDPRTLQKILHAIVNEKVNLRGSYTEKSCFFENDDIKNVCISFICETRNLQHACKLKRIMDYLFPRMCEFLEEPFSPISTCACYPRRFP